MRTQLSMARAAAWLAVAVLLCSAVVDGSTTSNMFPTTARQLHAHAVEKGHAPGQRGMLDALLNLHAPSTGPAVFNLFVDVMSKGYSVDPAVWAERYNTFKHNVEIIQNHNMNSSVGFTLGLNPYADWTDAEFKATFLNSIVREGEWNPPQVPKPDEHPEQYIPFDYEQYVPSERSVDWRKAGVIGPVKNQHINGSACGCCWAFATTGALETAVALGSGNSAMSLSEQQLIACDFHNGSTTENVGCGGGSWWLGMDYVINNDGLSTEAEYPYLAHNSECEKEKERNSQSGKNTIPGYQFIDSFNETAMIATVAHQPALAEICVGDDFVKYWQLYRGGVYDIEGCMKPIDHGVLVVGFNLDDNNGKGAWIIKNSWGSEWGEGGFMRAAMGLGPEAAPGKRQGIMNLHHRAAFPIVPLNKSSGLAKLSRSSIRSLTGPSSQ